MPLKPMSEKLAVLEISGNLTVMLWQTFMKSF